MNDLINGLFEIISGLLSFINIKKLLKDKQLKGISWIPVIFFTLWGLWNLYYYPSLNQILSLIGGMFILSSNLVWLILVFYFHKKMRK